MNAAFVTAAEVSADTLQPEQVLVKHQALAAERVAREQDQHEVNVLKNHQHKEVISIAIAQERHIRQKSYKGHWAGWTLVQVKRTVKTKAGVAFQAGDFSHARKDPQAWQNAAGSVWIVYSHRNGIDTALAGKDVELVY